MRTAGSVLTSFSMLSSKLSFDLRMFFMNSATGERDWPSCDMENVPSLFSRITAGIEGKTKHASRESLRGCTTSTICTQKSY